MSLKEKLEEIKAASTKRIPADKRVVMEQANKELRESGILSGVAAVGQKAPAFAGTASDGRAIAFNDLLRRPMVLSFFRGHW